MRLIISIEGDESNTEVNIFNELKAVSLAVYNESNFEIISISIRRTSRIHEIGPLIQGAIRRKISTDINIEKIFVIHDWDKIDQKNPLNQVFAEIKRLNNEKEVHRINFPSNFLDTNNIEGELIGKVRSGVIIEKSSFWKEFQVRPKNLKSESFTNILSHITKEHINIYTEEGLCLFLENLKNNNSVYYEVFLFALNQL